MTELTREEKITMCLDWVYEAGAQSGDLRALCVHDWLCELLLDPEEGLMRFLDVEDE